MKLKPTNFTVDSNLDDTVEDLIFDPPGNKYNVYSVNGYGSSFVKGTNVEGRGIGFVRLSDETTPGSGTWQDVAITKGTKVFLSYSAGFEGQLMDVDSWQIKLKL